MPVLRQSPFPNLNNWSALPRIGRNNRFRTISVPARVSIDFVSQVLKLIYGITLMGRRPSITPPKSKFPPPTCRKEGRAGTRQGESRGNPWCFRERSRPPCRRAGASLYSILTIRPDRDGSVGGLCSRPTIRHFSPVRSAQWVPKQREKADARSAAKNVVTGPEFGIGSSRPASAV